MLTTRRLLGGPERRTKRKMIGYLWVTLALVHVSSGLLRSCLVRPSQANHWRNPPFWLNYLSRLQGVYKTRMRDAWTNEEYFSSVHLAKNSLSSANTNSQFKRAFSKRAIQKGGTEPMAKVASKAKTLAVHINKINNAMWKPFENNMAATLSGSPFQRSRFSLLFHWKFHFECGIKIDETRNRSIYGCVNERHGSLRIWRQELL